MQRAKQRSWKFESSNYLAALRPCARYHRWVAALPGGSRCCKANMTKISEKYLVTGGAGFIGAHLVRRLVAERKTVRVVDNLSTGKVSRLADLMTAIEFIEGDLADKRVSQEVVKEIDLFCTRRRCLGTAISSGPRRDESSKHYCYPESFGKLAKCGIAAARLRCLIVCLRRHRGSSQTRGHAGESALAPTLSKNLQGNSTASSITSFMA